MDDNSWRDWANLTSCQRWWDRIAARSGEPDPLTRAKAVLDDCNRNTASPAPVMFLDWLGSQFEGEPGLAGGVLADEDFTRFCDYQFTLPEGPKEVPGPRLLLRAAVRLFRSGQEDRARQACDAVAGLAGAWLAADGPRLQSLRVWVPEPASLIASLRGLAGLPCHRALFPTEVKQGPEGRLAWAEVVALQAGELGLEPGLHLAPWSFYLPLRADGWREVRENVEGAAGAGGTYLVSLQPPAGDDLGGRTAEHKIRAAALAPRTLSLRGPSLGLALGLAVDSALRRRQLRPLVATGVLGRDGKVSGVDVDGIRSKLGAMKWAWLAGGAGWPFLTPADNHRDGSLGRAQRELKLGADDGRVRPVDRLAVITADPWYYHDGFLSYREAQMAAPRSSRGPDGDGPQGEVDRAARRWQAALGWLEGEPGGPGELVSDFGDDPARLAAGVFDRLVGAWLGREQTRWFSDTVPFRVDLDAVQKRPWDGDAGALPGLLARWTGWEVDGAADAFKDALSTPEKLLLVVHGPPSQELWPRRRQAHEALRSLLALGREGAQRKPQRLLVVYSDDHHRRRTLAAP